MINKKLEYCHASSLGKIYTFRKVKSFFDAGTQNSFYQLNSWRYVILWKTVTNIWKHILAKYSSSSIYVHATFCSQTGLRNINEYELWEMENVVLIWSSLTVIKVKKNTCRYWNITLKEYLALNFLYKYIAIFIFQSYSVKVIGLY